MTPNNEITADELQAIRALESRGFCVIVWMPEEIGEADVGQLEDIVISRGNDYLEEVNRDGEN